MTDTGLSVNCWRTGSGVTVDRNDDVHSQSLSGEDGTRTDRSMDDIVTYESSFFVN